MWPKAPNVMLNGDPARSSAELIHFLAPGQLLRGCLLEAAAESNLF